MPSNLPSHDQITSDDRFVVRVMTRDEVPIAIEWARIEGWNPGLNDAACFHAADPDGFFLGLLDGEPVGCASAVVYDDRFAFFGLFIVRPEYRDQGFGRRLAEVSTEHMRGRSIGLDGVVAMQQSYARHGYRLAYRNIRYQGICPGAADATLVPLASVPMETILAYDRIHFGAPREAFLRMWISQDGATSLAAVEDGQLRGYGVLRRCHEGYKIGPLFADSESIAERLFRSLVANTVDQPVVLDTPEVNRAAVALAERFQMRPVFETARMYTGPGPEIPVEQIFGVTTFELG